jgi:predicted TPR repeat methyltransferase
MARDERLKQAYAVQTPDEVKTLYRDWADGYERDVVDQLGYVAPRHAARAFAAAFPHPDGQVLDVGCGTGLVGRELRDLGYRNVDGLDISPDMLRVASEKAIYDRVMEGDLTERLPLGDDSYDAIVCVGTFTHGHVGPDGLGELIRVIRPGGPITFTVNDGVYDDHGYDDALATLETDGIARVAARARADYLPGENIGCRLITLTAG